MKTEEMTANQYIRTPSYSDWKMEPTKDTYQTGPSCSCLLTGLNENKKEEESNQEEEELTLGKLIKKKRIQLGFKVEAFSEIIGVTSVTMYNWEHEKNVPSLRMLKLLGDVLEIDFETIYSLWEKEERMTKINRKERK